MIEFARGLSPGDFRALAELEMRVLDVDGGRLKLEWGVLRARAGRDIEDLLWWEGDRLVGFIGLYAFGAPTVEIAGMVDPSARRRGIATELFEAALPICRECGYQRALLVTPRRSVAGRAFALSRGAVLEHSEHALVLLDAPIDGPADLQIALRTATLADAADLSRLLDAAFGEPSSDVLDRLAEDSSRTLVVELRGSPVGTVRVTRDQDSCGIYGFAVDPAWQGRGIGRDVLRRVCRELRDEGVQHIGLEVAVDNDHALGLYSSLGFTHITTEDYYELPLGQPGESDRESDNQHRPSLDCRGPLSGGRS
jgi:ribosomal protein S18 acetylase RimI-like enzyme